MIVIKIAAKTFNGSLLLQELTGALPLNSLSWAGFQRQSNRRYEPFAEVSRVVGRSSVAGDDVALRGELRLSMSRSLTATEDTTLDSLLTAHNATQLNAEQTRQDQDETDLDSLIVTEIGAYRNNIRNWDSMTNVAKMAAAKEMFIVLGKALRFLLRNQRGGDV